MHARMPNQIPQGTDPGRRLGNYCDLLQLHFLQAICCSCWLDNSEDKSNKNTTFVSPRMTRHRITKRSSDAGLVDDVSSQNARHISALSLPSTTQTTRHMSPTLTKLNTCPLPRYTGSGKSGRMPCHENWKHNKGCSCLGFYPYMYRIENTSAAFMFTYALFNSELTTAVF